MSLCGVTQSTAFVGWKGRDVRNAIISNLDTPLAGPLCIEIDARTSNVACTWHCETESMICLWLPHHTQVTHDGSTMHAHQPSCMMQATDYVLMYVCSMYCVLQNW